MTAPNPTPGADNPFVLGYQTKHYPTTDKNHPDVNIFSSLATPPESGTDAVEATRYNGPGGGTGGTGASGASGGTGGTGA